MTIAEITKTLLDAKKAKGVTFAQLEEILGRDEVWIASVIYRQASADRCRSLTEYTNKIMITFRKSKNYTLKIIFCSFVINTCYLTTLTYLQPVSAQIFRMDTSPFREGSVLNGNLTNNLLDAIENNLRVKGLPYEWINDLRKSPPRISFLGKTRMGENQALYQPATNPFGL